MDNLKITRVWRDNDFTEIIIAAKSKQIQAYTISYANEDLIEKLSEKLIAFNGRPDDEFIWEHGIKGDEYTPYVSLAVICKDELGHIQVEIYFEINSGGPLGKHHCCFFIETELGLLHNFGKSLKHINAPTNDPALGMEIVLNPEE